MKIAFIFIVALHASLHMLGFIKAFELAPLKELTLPVSKTWGVIWLLGFLLLLGYAVSVAIDYSFSWIIGVLAVLVSQFLIIQFWGDAKFGTIPNALILIVLSISFGSYRFDHMVAHERDRLMSALAEPTPVTITDRRIANLPAPVKHWLTTSGMVGRPALQYGWIRQQAMMKLKTGQKDWQPATALQLTTVDPPAFLWTVDMDMPPFIKISGRDKFVAGKGSMRIKIFSLIDIVDEQGPKIDEGSIQRLLGEIVWFPSMALCPHISWEKLDEKSAKATMDLNGTKGSGIFFFSERGDFERFEAMRFKGNDPEAKRYPWIMTAEAYNTFEGIRVPSRLKATWKLDEGDWTWLLLEVVDIDYF